MAVSTSVSQVSTNASGANGLKRASDSIPNMNVWTALAKASINATSEYFNSMSKRRELEAQSNSLMYQAQSALMNSQIVESKLSLIPAMKELNKIAIETNNSNVLNAQNDVYNQYRMGEYQAMEQGLRDAQIIHGQRAQTASSGVLMSSASKAELDQSNVMAAEINQHIIQENTNSAARRAQANVTNLQNQSIELLSQSMQLIGQEADLKMQQANFMAQAAILEGDSKASNIMAKSIKPFLNAGYEFGLTMAQWGSQNYMGSIGGK